MQASPVFWLRAAVSKCHGERPTCRPAARPAAGPAAQLGLKSNSLHALAALFGVAKITVQSNLYSVLPNLTKPRSRHGAACILGFGEMEVVLTLQLPLWLSNRSKTEVPTGPDYSPLRGSLVRSRNPADRSHGAVHILVCSSPSCHSAVLVSLCGFGWLLEKSELAEFLSFVKRFHEIC